jgi:hypothetical protein
MLGSINIQTNVSRLKECLNIMTTLFCAYDKWNLHVKFCIHTKIIISLVNIVNK